MSQAVFTFAACIHHAFKLLCLSQTLSLSLSLSLSISLYLSKGIYLPIYLPIYLSTYLPIYHSTILSIYLSVHLSRHVSIHLSIYLPIYLSTILSVYLPIYVPTYLPAYLPTRLSSIYMFIALSVSLFIYLSIDLSIYLSIRLSVCIYVFAHSYSAVCAEYLWHIASLSLPPILGYDAQIRITPQGWDQSRHKIGAIPRPPNVSLLTALWSLLVGRGGIVKGSWGVLVNHIVFKHQSGIWGFPKIMGLNIDPK